MNTLRILIVDDHILIRRGVRDLLATRKDWQVVGEAADGADAVRKAAELKPDVVILDFSMPAMSGPEASAEIMRRLPNTGVVILTMHQSERVFQDVVRAGARALVLKSDADRILIEAVEAVAQKRHYFASSVSHFVTAGHPGPDNAPQPPAKERDPRLTDREREVVRLLADGLTSKEIARNLEISPRTVESHRLNINRKIGIQSTADLIRYAIRKGIVSYV